jgi:hypothetical protein
MFSNKPIEFETAEEFIKYYNENKALLDSMSTYHLNKSFHIKNLYICKAKDIIDGKYKIKLTNHIYKPKPVVYDVPKDKINEKCNELEARIQRLELLVKDLMNEIKYSSLSKMN